MPVKKTAKPIAAKAKKTALPKELSAKTFVERLKAIQSDAELKKIQRYSVLLGSSQPGHEAG